MKYIKTLEQFINESEVNEGAGTLKQKYEQLIKNLEKAKVPCKVKLTDSEIIIECGWNYPDSLADKVFDAADAANLKDNEISVVADHAGPGIIDTKRLNGGPKRY
jgi:UDP-N-acetylglucosamine transferase subunit ALG13